jgi:YfiH family protein
MQHLGACEGADVVRFACGVGLFGRADAAPPGLSSEALARDAGARLEPLARRPLPVLYARQEHTRLAFVYSRETDLEPGPHLVGTCDALITAERGVALCVRTADCLPVMLTGGGAIAMVHAGWRGLAADILGAVLKRLANEFGVAAADTEAVIGVGVGPCHYPVGTDVRDALGRHAVASERWHADGRADLAAWARGRLLALGVAAESVTVLPGCTACSTAYHSYRRDGKRAGRQWNAIALT